MKSATPIRKISIRVLALCLLASSVHAGPVVFQSTDTPPYWSARLPDNGFGGAVLKLLSENANVAYTLEYLPVKRFRQSTAPYLVGDPDILITPKPRAIFPVGVFRTAFIFYKPHHDVIEFHSIRDMKGHTLGVLRGTIEDKASYIAIGVNVEESDSIESLLRKLKKGRIDFCITVAGAGRYTIQKIFPQETENFAEAIIPALDRPITIMVDMDTPENRDVAVRYRQVLVKTLHSAQYRRAVENFYGKNKIPADREQQLNKFIQYYANTWN